MMGSPVSVRKHRAPKGALRPLTSKLGCDTGPLVRKHRAPKGALRRMVGRFRPLRVVSRQKSPSAKRCIKTRMLDRQNSDRASQKAPSAKRCIKTRCTGARGLCSYRVRKHRAPKGALRRSCWLVLSVGGGPVRKHRAPKGALRPLRLWGPCCAMGGSQKAPSAKRCIKTVSAMP